MAVGVGDLDGAQVAPLARARDRGGTPDPLEDRQRVDGPVAHDDAFATAATGSGRVATSSSGGRRPAGAPAGPACSAAVSPPRWLPPPAPRPRSCAGRAARARPAQSRRRQPGGGPAPSRSLRRRRAGARRLSPATAAGSKEPVRRGLAGSRGAARATAAGWQRARRRRAWRAATRPPGARARAQLEDPRRASPYIEVTRRTNSSAHLAARSSGSASSCSSSLAIRSPVACRLSASDTASSRTVLGQLSSRESTIVGECIFLSRLPLPRYMWTPHGRHGSKPGPSALCRCP